MKTRRFALGLGGNLENTAESILFCIETLAGDNRLSHMKVASLYETPPWGEVSGGNFFNTAVCGEWNGTDRELLVLCRSIEVRAGSSVEKNGEARILDVDILFLEDAVSSSSMTLPHPGMTSRRFVLVPLAEIWSSTVPGLGKTPAQLLQSVDDGSSVIFRGGLQVH